MSGGYWETVDPIWNKISTNSVKEFLDTYAHAAPHAAFLFAAHFCQSEVCNGGFHQFFYNSTGVLAPEAVQGFHAIGQHKVAETVQAAMDVLGSPYPRDLGLREVILSRFSPRSFDPLNEQFYALLDSEAGGFEVAANDYAARNGRLTLPRNPSAG
jgi:hypothetical protein